MLQSMKLASDESIERSRALEAFLEKADISDDERRDAAAELARVVAPVRQRIVDEDLNDLNGLESLLRGTVLGERQETYTVETDNLSKVSRYGWELSIQGGRKVMFDPARRGEPVYEDVPKMTVERTRTVYLVESNRAAIARIETLLRGFLKELRRGFVGAGIETLLEARRRVEAEVASVDRRTFSQETFSEAQLLDAGYLRRPVKSPAGPEGDLYRKFDELRNQVGG